MSATSTVTKKKTKLPVLKGEEAEEVIEQYLISQYKPFAINDIIQNLHNQVGRTQALKSLESLAQQGRIKTRTFGKIIIYACPEQALQLPVGADSSLYTMESIGELRRELVLVEKDLRAATEQLAELGRDPSNTELLELMVARRHTLQEVESRVAQLHDNWDSSNDKVIEQVMQNELKVDKALKSRAKILKSVLALAKDVVRPANMAEFLESIGYEAIE